MNDTKHALWMGLTLAALSTTLYAGPRETDVLPVHDGWASLPTTALPQGTTGGSSAAPERVHTVRDRNELVAALAYPDPTPKIVRIVGRIDANVDAQGQALSCDDYARPDPQTGTLYTLDAFLAAYDPATWGRVAPSGALERARAASAAAQQARVRIRIPANTTVIGVGRDASLHGAWFDIRPGSSSGNQPMNVIVRNLSFQDSYDCFPQWSPNDGAEGNWNSAYDSISVRNATHVWIDRNEFRDVATDDGTLPSYYGRLYQIHDGLVDVTNESDLVTVSWNRFAQHDKAMLIGSSDSATADRGKLRVSLHHNLFHDLGQRVPRVRYGQVHVYNNLYVVGGAGAPRYAYSWGVGVESQINAQNNHFLVDRALTPAFFIDRLNGSRIQTRGTLRNGWPVDPVAAYNAVNDADLIDTVDWTPTLYRRIDPTWSVPLLVLFGAGPQR